MIDIMIDLETWGTEPGSAIASIGACVVGDPDARFYETVTLESCQAVGLTVSASTIKFWLRQADNARLAILGNESNSIEDALRNLSTWIMETKFARNTKAGIWGNGANFDPPLLEAAYRACNLDVPWNFYEVRCYRTMKSLVSFKANPAEVPHHALYDALAQAEHLVRIREALGLRTPIGHGG